MKPNTRDYGKLALREGGGSHPRFVVGGIVRKPEEADEPLRLDKEAPETPTLPQRRQQMDHSDDPVLELEEHRGLSKKQEPDKYDEPEPDDEGEA